MDYRDTEGTKKNEKSEKEGEVDELGKIDI